MVNFVIIEKSGTITTKNDVSLNINELYKKCNFRKNNDFNLAHIFKMKNYYLFVYGKVHGKANQENKFEFPPPIDNTLFFGSMAILKSYEKNIDNNNIVDYDSQQWKKDYEKLMGGFEDLNSDGEYESDELKEYSKEELTKEGYLKDDFVVDETEETEETDEPEKSNSLDSDDEYSDSELSEEDYEDED
jgi:hypothetical protein